jgi:hypothetical protein
MLKLHGRREVWRFGGLAALGDSCGMTAGVNAGGCASKEPLSRLEYPCPPIALAKTRLLPSPVLDIYSQPYHDADIAAALMFEH